MKYDAIIVGGGSIGTSVLYHLSKTFKRVALIERHKLSAGTTWHSAGMLWRLRPSYVDIELHTYTRDLCKKLDVYHENGGLFIANNTNRLDEYKRLHETGKYYGIESHVLTPAEVKDIHPLLNVDDVVGGLYSPTDGTIDPTGFVTALARESKKQNPQVEIHEETGVRGLFHRDGNPAVVNGVILEDESILESDLVINACGAWGKELYPDLTLLPMKHAFVVTEKMNGVHNMLPNVRDHDLSIYLKTQGNSLAIGGYEQNPEFWGSADKNFAFGLFELDWDTFAQNLDGHLKRCPDIENAGIQSTVCGPESFTPDHKPLVGYQPGVTGLFHACGFNSMGMMLGGGMGMEIAHWVTNGSPQKDMFAYDISRFHPDSYDEKCVKDRTHESYAKTYAIVYPHDEPLAGRGIRQSALYESLLHHGCVYQSRHGFERPGWFNDSPVPPKEYDYYGAYGDMKHKSHPYEECVQQELTFDFPDNHDIVASECNAARNGVALFDQSYFGKFFITGTEAFDAVQHLSTADFTKKKPGDVVYTTLCNKNGGVEADLTITYVNDRTFYVAAGGNTMTKDLMWIKKNIKHFDAYVQDASDDMVMLSVQGPHSANLLQRMTGARVNLKDDIPFSTYKNIRICGFDNIMCLRLTFVGELGYELHMPSYIAPEVYKRIYEEGQRYSSLYNVPVKNAGYRAIDSLSAEKGYRHWHADLANCDTPMEANIGFTVIPKLKNGKVPFIGRDALQKQRDTGVFRKLVCLVLDDTDVLLHGNETIWLNDNEKCVGIVRSTAFGHTIGKSIAYGYVENDTKITNKWLSSQTYSIGVKGEKKYSATLHLKSPYDPKNTRINI